MNSEEIRQTIGQLFGNLAEELDVPPNKYQDAKDRYDSVGSWLNAEDSDLRRHLPEIHPQGSFALGTATRPLGEEEYDVDAVCRLNLPPQGVNQQQLKNMVGDRLKKKKQYASMLDPKDGGRRCWTLHYSEESKFHLDILPAIPDSPGWLVALGVPSEMAKHAILITDKTTWNCDSKWPHSNPKGYAEWFKSRMSVVLNERRSALAAERRARVEDIKDYEVRTPLQRIVQLLKRHRDIRYNGDDDKPISIIITTLAGQVYKNEASLDYALDRIVPGMRNLVVKRNGVWWIPNPVNPAENFADKWVESPRKAQVFFEWLNQLETEYKSLLTPSGFVNVDEYLTESFGARESSKALARLSERLALRTSPKGNTSLPVIVESVRKVTSLTQPHQQPPPWPVRTGNSVKITAQWRKTASWRPFDNNSGYLTKGCDLRFNARTDVPLPYEVYWQVVNTGREARDTNDLRGEFSSGNRGPLIREEKTRYRGRHWIECFIVKDGVCVARSSEFIINVA